MKLGPHMIRVRQTRTYAPYMTVYLVISLPRIPYVHHVYMVLANPIHMSRPLMGFALLVRGSRCYKLN